MKNEPTNTDDARYKCFRGKYVVFALRESETGSEFIALPGNTSDADAERIARATAPGDWRKVVTIHFDSIQSNAMPGSESQR